jgi:hypothetical protein
MIFFIFFISSIRTSRNGLRVSSGRLAARCPRAAGDDADDRLPQRGIAWPVRARLTAFHKGLSEAGAIEGQNWRSNVAGRKGNMIDSRRLPPIRLAAGSW